MANPRIQIVKHLSPWNIASYDALVDGEKVGTYRLKADAQRAAEAHLVYLKEREDQLWEDMKLEHD